MYAFQLTPSMVPFAITSFVSTLVFLYIAKEYIQQKRKITILSFLILLSGIISWQLTNLFVEAATDKQLKLVGKNFVNAISVPTISYATLAIALSYSHREKYVWHVTTIFIIHTFSLITLLFFYPEFFYEAQGIKKVGTYSIGFYQFDTFVSLEREIKPAFIFYTCAMISVVLWSLLIIIRYHRVRDKRETRVQAGILLFSILTPVGAAVLLVAEVVSPVWNPVDFSLSITAIGLAIAIRRYGALDFVPISKNKAINLVDDPIIILDNTYRITDYNKKAKEFAGRQTDLKGQLVESAFEMFQEPIYQSIKDQDDRVKCKIDTEEAIQYFAISSTLVTDSRDEDHAYVTVFRDLTEIIEKKNKIESKNKQLQRFSSILTHDIRSPLSVAQTNIELGIKQDNIIQYSDRIVASINRVSQIVDDMERLARLESAEMDTQQVELSVAAAQAWGVSDTANAVVNIDDNMPVVSGYKSQIYQMFENIFRNAVVHAGGDAIIDVGSLNDGGFYIEDNGDGVPENIRDQVWEYGFTSKEEGTGIGLIVVKRVVERHNWTIDISDSQSGGARFEIRFSDDK
ncbi:PAS domain-containing protein [Halorubrum sp. ARQ200]|nr:PAS domain-containing protein [Halorubrum sp. ARQ200]